MRRKWSRVILLCPCDKDAPCAATDWQGRLTGCAVGGVNGRNGRDAAAQLLQAGLEEDVRVKRHKMPSISA
jgi:hypothetical protein